MPYPSQPVGQYTGAFPFDHIVLVMQENHSFDNYLGIPRAGDDRAAVESARLTYRDANAATLADFLDPSVMSLRRAPRPGRPGQPLPGLVQGYQGQPVPPAPASTVPDGVLIA